MCLTAACKGPFSVPAIQTVLVRPGEVVCVYVVSETGCFCSGLLLLGFGMSVEILKFHIQEKSIQSKYRGSLLGQAEIRRL